MDKTDTAEMFDRDTWRAYYLLQYERIAHHENARLQISAFVFAGSLVGLSLSADEALRLGPARITLLAIALANAIAVIYTRLTQSAVKVHIDRSVVARDRLDTGLGPTVKAGVGIKVRTRKDEEATRKARTGTAWKATHEADRAALKEQDAEEPPEDSLSLSTERLMLGRTVWMLTVTHSVLSVLAVAALVIL